MIKDKNTSLISNTKICQLIAKNDWQGMELLFKIYYKRLVVCADSYLHDLNLAEDVIQELFISLWEQRHKRVLRNETLSSFLFIAVRNQCLHRIEKQDIMKHSFPLDGIEEAYEEYNEKYDQILERILTEIESLPPRSREIMKEVFVNGLKYREVAEKYQISLSTVKTLLGHSIQKIKERLDDDAIAFLLFFFKKN